MVAVYSGTAPIEAHDEAVVVAKVGGEVRQIYVEEGDTVKAGQVLARLDGDRLRLEVAQTEANLRKLERDYKRTLGAQPRRAWSPRAPSRTPSSTWTRCAPRYDRARLELELHRDPRADRRRRLGAAHQGRQHDQRRTTRRSGSRTSTR